MKYYMGIDIGKKDLTTAIIVARSAGGTFRIVPEEEWELEWRKQMELYTKLLRRHGETEGSLELE